MTEPLIPATRQGYLNTALTGLPPAIVTDAARAVLDDWAAGRLDWTMAVDRLAAARAASARLTGVDVHRVGVGHSTAGTLSAIAAGLPDDALVLAPEGEHNSSLYPLLHQAHRGVRVELAPLEALAERVGPQHAAVAFGLVQSADGRVADLPAISAAARAAGAWVLVDATQACGWLPFDLDLCDIAVTAVYKWLLTPNGPAFLVLHPAAAQHFSPAHRSWIGNLDVHAAPYGVGGEAAVDARRFDLVPNFMVIAAAEAACNLLAGIGLDGIRDHNVALAARFSEELGLPPQPSAIVSAPGDRLDPADFGLVATRRRNTTRFAFHLYNGDEDVARAVAFVKATRE